MTKIVIAVAAIAALWCGGAEAQSLGGAALVLPNGCGTANFAAGANQITMDSTGRVCVSAAVLAQSTVAGLPSCTSGLKGSLYGVTDATAPTYNATLTGGGTVAVPVYCNGTAWTAH